MQMSVHYGKDDQYLIDKLEEKARVDRKSKSAVVLSILESYFEAEKRIGQILRDLEALSPEELQEALNEQRRKREDEPLGRILLDKGYVREVDLDKALSIQGEGREEIVES